MVLTEKEEVVLYLMNIKGKISLMIGLQRDIQMIGVNNIFINMLINRLRIQINERILADRQIILRKSRSRKELRRLLMKLLKGNLNKS